MIADKLVLLTFIVARVAGLTMTAPIYGTNDVPVGIRGLLAVTISVLILPLEWTATTAAPGSLAAYAVLLGCEALIGACLGLGVLLLVHGMTLAGELIGHASGLTLSDVFDPMLEDNVPLFSKLFFLLAVCVFFCVGGHRLVMAGLLDTFQAIPPGAGMVPNSLADALVTLATLSFSLGVRAAAPALTALVLATIVLGLVSRTLPQMNVLSVGFNMNALLAFAVLALTIAAAVWAFQDQIEPAIETLLEAIRTKTNAGVS